ncbi:Domain of unknown function / Efflux ABC transporter, permease protein [hydrothermal vent metagenome]|uniref:ABC transmembrane type-2 domain-containing protein n=1 Tax=hydrothermal vent metagenome TaxID=652676 RepID=A0A3B1DFV2_9ZZZZ
MLMRIKEMIIKEFIQVFRDRRMLAIIFITPVIQMLAFGYAATTDVTDITTAVYDLDKSFESRELIRRIESSGYFRVKVDVEHADEIQYLLKRGKVIATIQINSGFSEDLKKVVPSSIQVIVDGTDSNTATVAMDYINRIIMKYSGDLNRNIETRNPTIDLRARAWYNPDLRSRNYNVPGVIAIVIMLTCLLLTSMAVVREWEVGTMEQLMVTPLRPIELMLGKTIPFAAIGFFDMLVVTIVAVFWFDIPIRGSLPGLALNTGVYLLSVLGMGLLISTISRTQQQAMMATFLFYMPAVLLSGFMFPIENMPQVIQYGTYINPLRYFLVIIRGIFLKGSGMDILWPQTLSLLLLSIGVVTLSSLRFKKRIR